MKRKNLIRENIGMVGVSIETALLFAFYVFICACAVGLGTDFANWLWSLL